jgi:signal transduction histidine kinase
LADEPFVEIAIADTGIGIAEEFLPNIFDKFRQIDSTTSRKYSGTGLGLYLVKCFVERLDGSVSVQSKLGKGTTFTVLIPFRTEVGLSPEILTTGVAASAYLEGDL